MSRNSEGSWEAEDLKHGVQGQLGGQLGRLAYLLLPGWQRGMGSRFQTSKTTTMSYELWLFYKCVCVCVLWACGSSFHNSPYLLWLNVYAVQKFSSWNPRSNVIVFVMWMKDVPGAQMLGHLSPPESAGLKGGYCGIFRGQGLTGWCQALWGLITRAQFLLPFACCSIKTWGREETQLHSPATMESLPPSLSLCDELHSLLRVKIPSSWVAITRHFLSNKQSVYVCVCVKKGEMVTFARSAGGGVSLTGKISALLEKTQASPLFLALIARRWHLWNPHGTPYLLIVHQLLSS